MKIVGAIHSPARMRSGLPSLLRSSHFASVTIPACDSPGDDFCVAYVSSHVPSLNNKKLRGDTGYLPGIDLPPTKRSKSPSASISAAVTADLALSMEGKAFTVVEEPPLPSFKKSRSCNLGSVPS